MAISKVDVWNQALATIGQVTRSKIETPDEDTPDANTIRAFYPISLDAFLDSHHWAWATKYATLSQDSADPVDSWAFSYKLPTDCIAPREIANAGPDDPIEFVTAITTGGVPVIYTSWADAVLIYTARTEDFNSWSPMAVRAFSYYLGMEIATTYTGGRQKAASIRGVYFQALEDARNASHQMVNPREPTENLFMDARG